MIRNSLRNICSTCSTMILAFSREFSLIVIIYLWLDTSVEYEFRGARNANEIRGPYRRRNFVYISHRDVGRMRKEIFHDRASSGRAHNLRFSSDSGGGWKMGWEMLFFVHHDITQRCTRKTNIRRMFLETLDGCSFSVGNISIYDNSIVILCSCSALFTLCYHKQ